MKLLQALAILSGGMIASILTPAAASACGFDAGTITPRNAVWDSRDGGFSVAPVSTDAATIIGMWKVQFTGTDGSGYTDFGYSQWHSDGTEFLNSGSRAPATQNFCMGVWARANDGSYYLNHFALSYDQTTGALANKVNIREHVTLSSGGNTYAGTFTLSLYDPTGVTLEGQITGTITGTRVTVATQNP